MWTILCRVLYESRRVEKCISLARLSKFMHGVQRRDSKNLLSSRTSRTSGHKHCRVDKEYCRVEKCIALGRLRRFKHVVVSEGPKQSVVESYKSYEWTQEECCRVEKCISFGRRAQAISCRVVRVVRMDTSIVESYGLYE